MDEAVRRKAIEQYDALIAAAPAKHSRLDWDDRSFKSSAIDAFDAAHIIKILLDDQPSYFAHKETIFQVLSMDVLAPGKKKFRKAAAAITVSDHLTDAYQRAFRQLKHPALAEQMANRRIAGPIFFDQIYYPLGGIKAVRDAPTRLGWGRGVQDRAKDVPDVISLMTVYHHHYEHLRMNVEFNRASLNLGSTLVKTVRKGEKTALGKRTVKDRWANMKDSAAFLYAAESIEHDGRTLLRCLIEDWLTFDHVEPLFAEWMARTKFVASEILMNCSERDTATINLAKLPYVKAMPFDAPTLTPVRAAEIANAFRRKPRGRKGL